jgi:hypothetical protein
MIIAELFEKLENLAQSMSELTTPSKYSSGNYEEEERERSKKSSEAFNEFLKFYNQKRIFFTKSSTSLVDDLINNYREAYVEHTTADLPGAEKYPALKKVREIMSKNIPEIKERLEEEFRKEVGIQQSPHQF